MIAKLTAVWRQNRLLVSAFLLALGVTVFFGGKLVLSTIYWADPAHRNQPIEGWMTLRYVAHSWNLRPNAIDSALDLPLDQRWGRISLERLADDRGVPVESLIARLEHLTQTRPPHGRLGPDAPADGPRDE